MIKSEVVIIDLLAERGHIQFVKNTIKVLSLKFNVIFISSKSYVEIIGHNNFLELEDELFINKSKYNFFFNQYKLIKKISSMNFNENANIIFTGFENITFAIFGRMKQSVFLYIHNNLGRKKISNLFLYLINKKHTFFVFEDYIQKYLENKNRKAISIPYPLWEYNNQIKNEDTKNYIFAPNVDPSSKEFNGLLDFAIINNLKIYVKHKSSISSSPNVIIKSFYKNYYEMIERAKYIALDIPYDYRVSAIFYDSMILNKKIIMLNSFNLFSINMRSLYSNNILIDFNSKKKNKIDNSSFLNKHKQENILKSYINSF